MIKRTLTGWVMVAVFIALCLWIVNPAGGFKSINLGIDLQGGTELQYELDLSSVRAASADVAEEVKDIISRRLDIYGLKEIRIAIEGEDRLVVTIPGGAGADTKFIEDQIKTAGRLQLQLVVTAPENNTEAKKAEYNKVEREYKVADANYVTVLRAWLARQAAAKKTGGAFTELKPTPPSEPSYLVRPSVRREVVNGESKLVDDRIMVLSNKAGDKVEGELIDSASYSRDPDTMRPMVTFGMNAQGSIQLGELTGSNINSPLAIVLDDQIRSSPDIKSRISSNGQITGDFTDQEVTSIVTILKGGSLKAPLTLISRNKVSSLLGQEAVTSSVKAILIGLTLVFVSIAIFYLLAGLVANFALAFNILAVLAYVACFRQTLTLPGVAGILLTIGMAIDANILIFERVREERERGKTLLQSLTTGYQRAFSVIFDSNLTTVITGVVLFNFGTGPVKGFAITLIAGIIISFVSSLFVTRLILSWFLNVRSGMKLRMNRVFATPTIKFSNIQKPFLLISCLVIVGSWMVVIPKGEGNYGIDFNGGARVGFTLSEAKLRSEVEAMVAEFTSETATDENKELFKDFRLQELNSVSGEPGREFILMTSIDEKAAEKVSKPAAAPKGAKEAPMMAAEKVREKLEAKLKEKGLLLPSPFSVNWQDTGATSSLVLDVNLERKDEFTPEKLKEKVNAVLESDDLAKKNDTFPGLKAESCSLVSEGKDSSSVSRYQMKFAAFTPSPTASAVGKGMPSREQAEAATSKAFSHESIKALCNLSEPFSTVSTVGATVSSDLQQKALIAFFISILGIVFYVSLRFEFYFGLAAIAALVHDVLISIGVIALTDSFFPGSYTVKINLPEVAALLTIIGYSINDTIVVFDRIRENLKIYGKNKLTFKECVDLSINQTLSRTLLTSATTLMTVCSLLFLGGEAIRGFAFTFLIGLIAGTYSSVFVASPILLMLRNRALERRAKEVTA
ncbi:MAG: protein translocase subunit SecD [Planctomycetota bacterium]|nr:protein translocase subunit SecD [Planctomycetota bacterium]